MSKKVAIKPMTTFRQCGNIKSRKHPDVQCPCPAVQGDFCARHVKNPTRFQRISRHSDEPIQESLQTNTSVKLQRWWRWYGGIRLFCLQGPAYADHSLAENDTDIFTLDSTAKIPPLYRWSYADSHKHIWLFDIRSLHMTHVEQSGEQLLNPYTREPLGIRSELSFQSRCQWLRDRKYCLTHISDDRLTPEQIWHQTILDMILKYDMLGYHIRIPWVEEMHLFQLQAMYIELWELWFYKLSLQPTTKELVVPGWRSGENLLFKIPPTHIQVHSEKKWWQRIIVELLERLVSSALTKEHKILGALYGMTAFAIVSPHVRVHYPWLVGE